MKNYSDLIKNKKERTLTAKGQKFVWRCIEIVAKQHGLTIYHSEIKELKEKIKSIMNELIIDKGYNLAEIKSFIKNRTINNIKINSGNN